MSEEGWAADRPENQRWLEAKRLLRDDSPEGAALREQLGLTREENDVRGATGWCATCGHQPDQHEVPGWDGCAGVTHGPLDLEGCACKQWVREPVRVQVRSEWEPVPAAEHPVGTSPTDAGAERRREG